MTTTFNKFSCCLLLLATATLGAGATAAEALKSGTPDIKHAGPLAFGSDGVLFVGDSINAAVFAIETSDKANSSPAEVNIEAVNQTIADMIGSSLEDTVINDLAVNPTSGNIYFSVSRGRGPGATPILFRTNDAGAIEEFKLDNVAFAKASFDNAPKSEQTRRGNPRMSAITDIQVTDNRVIVAGLSNEEFASKLRVFDFPFNGNEASTSIEVYHGAHGQLETRSPVRTFITYENTVLAAYTCTPLVTIPVDDLKGEKTMGKTIAELGNRNTPLDMIIYRQGDSDYLLMANSARGVMKIQLDMQEMKGMDSIKSRIDGTAGVKFETIDSLNNVVQLDKLGSNQAILLVENTDKTMDIKTIALP